MLGRSLSFKSQFVGLLVLLLLGALVVQGYVHELNQRRLTTKIEELVQNVADTLASQVRKNLNLPVNLQVHVKDRHGRRIWTSNFVGCFEEATSARMQPFLELVYRLAHGSTVPQAVVSGSSLQGESAGIGESMAAASLTDESPWLLAIPARPVSLAAHPTLPPNAVLLRSGKFVLGPVGSNGESEEEIDLTPFVAEINSLSDEYRRLDLLATAGIFVFGIGVALFLGTRVTRPIYQVVDAFRGVSEGRLDTRLEPSQLTGEFRVLGGQFNQMVESIQRNQNLERELEQRERIQHMGDLAAGVAHDVRNPLNAIHLNIGQVRDEFLPSDPTARDRFLRFTADAQSEVKRLNNLITDFLSLAQPGSVHKESVSPNELLRDMERLLHAEAVSRRVALSTQLDPQLDEPAAYQYWARQELKSVFLNVAMNALQAMEPAGGQLDLLSGVRPGAGAEREELVISFVDTGHGIAPENLERVFIPYFTLRSGGTGLGLPIARRITERNGGRMELRSRLGEGTTVSFVFPLSRPTAPAAEVDRKARARVDREVDGGSVDGK